MRDNLRGALWRLAILVIVCGLGTFGLFMVFAQLRFQDQTDYNAEFTNVSGLKNGDFVRIAGVEVGKVQHISIRPDTVVVVDFSAENDVVLTGGTRAVIRYDNVIGDRYLALDGFLVRHEQPEFDGGANTQNAANEHASAGLRYQAVHH